MRSIPRREGPLAVPVVDLPGDVDGRQLARRRVLLIGPVDAASATRAAAELMELDGRSRDEVELVVNSDGGRLGDVLALLDVIELMRSPVRTRCVGRAMGTAAVLLACGTGGRRAAAHSMISLRCAEPERIEGSPEQLRRQVEELEVVRRNVVAALAATTRRSEAELLDQLERGPLLDPPRAVELGIIDGVDTR